MAGQIDGKLIDRVKINDKDVKHGHMWINGKWELVFLSTERLSSRWILHPVFVDEFERPNQTTLPAPWVRQVNGNSMQVVDGELQGRTQHEWSQSYVNVRIPSLAQYVRFTMGSYADFETVAGSFMYAILRSGDAPDGNNTIRKQWNSYYIRGIADSASQFQVGSWRENTISTSMIPRDRMSTLGRVLKPGDDVVVMALNREFSCYINGRLVDRIVATFNVTKIGYFAGIALSTLSKITRFECGYVQPSNILDSPLGFTNGDNFERPNGVMDNPVWAQATDNPPIIWNGQLTAPVSATRGSLIYAYQRFAKKGLTNSAFVVRGVLGSAPSTLIAAAGTILWGRSDPDLPWNQGQEVGFMVTPTGGAAIVTRINGVMASIKTIAGSFAENAIIELVVYENRYTGVVDGTPVIEWFDENTTISLAGFGSAVSVSSSTTAAGVTTYGRSLKQFDMVSHFGFYSGWEKPKINSVVPKQLPLAGGQVSIFGVDIAPSTGIYLGSPPVEILGGSSELDSLGGISLGARKVVLPAMAAGVYPLTVSNSLGNTSVNIEYVNPPVFTNKGMIKAGNQDIINQNNNQPVKIIGWGARTGSPGAPTGDSLVSNGTKTGLTIKMKITFTSSPFNQGQWHILKNGVSIGAVANAAFANATPELVLTNQSLGNNDVLEVWVLLPPYGGNISLIAGGVNTYLYYE